MMTQGSADDLAVQLMLTEPRIAKLTENAVAEALEGFPLQPQATMRWLARAIQGALYASIVPASDSPERASNVDTRDELRALSSQLMAAWLTLAERSDAADSAIWDYAWRSSVREQPASGEGNVDPVGDQLFQQAIAQLDWLAAFLGRAAEAISPQKPAWRQTERREERIYRAQCLSPVFERAFGREPTVNTWATAKSMGHWPDFYQRVVSLAFGEKRTPNLEGVLDEARRRDKAHRVTFGPGIIPDSPL